MSDTNKVITIDGLKDYHKLLIRDRQEYVRENLGIVEGSNQQSTEIKSLLGEIRIIQSNDIYVDLLKPNVGSGDTIKIQGGLDVVDEFDEGVGKIYGNLVGSAKSAEKIKYTPVKQLYIDPFDSGKFYFRNNDQDRSFDLQIPLNLLTLGPMICKSLKVEINMYFSREELGNTTDSTVQTFFIDLFSESFNWITEGNKTYSSTSTFTQMLNFEELSGTITVSLSLEDNWITNGTVTLSLNSLGDDFNGAYSVRAIIDQFGWTYGPSISLVE